MPTSSKRRTRKVRELIVEQETGKEAQRETEIVIDEQASQARDLAQELATRFADQIGFILQAYHEDKDGKWTPQRARHQAAERWGETDIAKLKNLPPDKIHWPDLSAIANRCDAPRAS
jgi:NADH dehydrogenase/NADH:ubiquinone oxidoreductase subunit G